MGSIIFLFALNELKIKYFKKIKTWEEITILFYLFWKMKKILQSYKKRNKTEKFKITSKENYLFQKFWWLCLMEEYALNIKTTFM